MLNGSLIVAPGETEAEDEILYREMIPEALAKRFAEEILNCPKFICLRVNKAYNSIMLKPCEREDPMSYKVPENFLKKHNCVFRIHAQTFVRTILDANGFDPMGTYAFHSMYLPDKNSIIVPLNNPKRDSTIETDDVETVEEES